jgi:hypothetical protein
MAFNRQNWPTHAGVGGKRRDHGGHLVVVLKWLSLQGGNAQAFVLGARRCAEAYALGAHPYINPLVWRLTPPDRFGIMVASATMPV